MLERDLLGEEAPGTKVRSIDDGGTFDLLRARPEE
jgi:hypothetical protein